MASSYPGSLDSFTSKKDSINDVEAAHMNDLQNALLALQTEMGIDPASTPANAFTNVVGRLNSNVQVIDRDVVVAELVSSVAETTMYSFTVPANVLSNNRALRMTVVGDLLNNEGTPNTVIWRFKYGSTTIAFNSEGIATASARRPTIMICTLSARNSTGAQNAFALWYIGNSIGVGGVADVYSEQNGGSFDVSISEDSTGALAFFFTIEHDTSSVDLSSKVQTVTLELLGS